VEAVSLMANVIKLRPGEDPDEVLQSAIGEYKSVVVIGWDKQDRFNGRSSLNLEAAEVILLIELLKSAILDEVVE
jgi:hypothetical protein